MIYNTTILLPNLTSLYEILKNKDNESLYSCKCFYEDRIAIQHYIKGDMNIINIWKSKSLFDWWFDYYNSRNFIATINYKILESHIKINHIGINDYDYKNIYNKHNLDEYDSEELIKNMINFVKLVAIKENKRKIVLDVHENLRLYFKYYYYLGFNTTNRKCKENPFWVETILEV